jgi:hypothetical protein
MQMTDDIYVWRANVTFILAYMTVSTTIMTESNEVLSAGDASDEMVDHASKLINDYYGFNPLEMAQDFEVEWLDTPEGFDNGED